ncbi:integrase domain-containing protein [Shewanella baltica]|uniref:integrase domain-containing protein n=1 Tax=Shewanella baltica TaxID=62322 RepID=UPI003984DE81
MARLAKPLSDTEIKTAKPKDKEYNLADGSGLQIRIKPNGSKLWLLNYSHPITKKRQNLSLGSYPDISLLSARKLAQEARTLIAHGADPKAHREEQIAAKAAIVEHTFGRISAEWFDQKKDAITEDHAAATWRSFKRHLLPSLKDIPISQITAPMVITFLRPIEAKGNLETVKRLAQRLNEVMIYAVNTGLIPANPLSGIKAIFKKPRKEHLAAMKPSELPELMQAIANASIKKVTRFLIEWQLHTMTRPNEAAAARWDEINFEERIWHIPSTRMKMRRDHIIPLTEQTLALLQAIKPISGHREFIFPAERDPKTHCNVQTANAALVRMGLKNRTTAHGFRSLASTTLNEQGFDPDVIEAALAHTDKNQVRSAYNRSM